MKKPSTCIISIHFDNKGLEFIHLSSIFQEYVIINCLPGTIQEGEIPSTVYSLSNIIRNKVLNYKDTSKTKDNRTCLCNCV